MDLQTSTPVSADSNVSVVRKYKLPSHLPLLLQQFGQGLLTSADLSDALMGVWMEDVVLACNWGVEYGKSLNEPPF